MKFPFLLLCLALCACTGDSRDSARLQGSIEELRHDVRRLEKKLDEALLSRASRAGLDADPVVAPPPQTSATVADDATPKVEKERKKVEAIEMVSFEMDGSEEDDPYLGPSDAPRVLMAFTNFECSTCRDFVRETLPKLRTEFINDGKLKFILRDFPLPQQVRSGELSQIAHCAGEQGVYWEAHEALSSAAEKATPVDPKQLATFLRLKDSKKFISCAKGTRYRREVERDQMDGERLGVTGIPAFFLAVRSDDGTYRGVRIRGAQPYGVFRKAIENMELN
ncbi:MAG: thioredoxin domain-containing protein [Deltaproteobacteria bacterium]|nr:thioredoxin domain-containing protein [Deltaproteobacteria bacterium]